MDLDPGKCLAGHEFAQAEELPSVGREDGDLGRQVLLAQEVLAQLHYKMSLMLVLMTFTLLDLLLRKGVLYEEEVGGDPLERERMTLGGSCIALVFPPALADAAAPERPWRAWYLFHPCHHLILKLVTMYFVSGPQQIMEWIKNSCLPEASLILISTRAINDSNITAWGMAAVI